MKQETKRKRKFKEGNVVIVKSPAGDAIPDIHVRLLERIERKPSKGRTLDWPGYVGWEAEIVYQSEADMLRRDWSIPYEGPGDRLFVYERNIVKRVIKLKPEKIKTSSNQENKKKRRRRIVRTRNSG